jgi:hypothetical protein
VSAYGRFGVSDVGFQTITDTLTCYESFAQGWQARSGREAQGCTGSPVIRPEGPIKHSPGFILGGQSSMVLALKGLEAGQCGI